MRVKKHILTQSGYDDLKQEHQRLVNQERPTLIDQIERARALGDLRENEAYHAARHKLSLVQGRIEELEVTLDNAEIAASTPNNGNAAIGSVVNVKIGQEEKEFTLVGEQEADLTSGRISVDSPLGQAMLGAKSGETISFNAPAGALEYTIISIT